MNILAVHDIVNEILGIRQMTVAELLQHPISKKAISLGELNNQTSGYSVKYKKGCTAKLNRAMPKYGRWLFTVQCTEKWSKGPYDVRFKLIKQKGKKTKGVLGREIEMSCSCNAWRYNGADWNAKTKNYSERQFSNGQSPDIRDPNRKYLICKHIAACVPILQGYLIPKGFK